MFNKTLINDGYTEHISEKLIDNSKIFYHNAEKINSGFLNSSNNVMSVREKFDEIDDEVLKYRTLIESEINAKFEVYVTYDGNVMELHQDVINEVPVFTEPNNQRIIRKNMSIIIKNTGDIPLSLMTMFPGARDINIRNYANDIAFCSDNHRHYDNVLLLYGKSNETSNSVFEQTLGQWIYFRNDNPYTYEKLYSTKLYETYTVNDKPSMQIMYNPTFNITTTANSFNITDSNLEAETYEKYPLIFEHISTGEEGKHFTIGSKISNNDSLHNFVSSVLVPNPKGREDLLCEIDRTDNSQKKNISAHQEATIPLVFEYYLYEGPDTSSSSNTIAFTFRPSRLSTPVTYVLKVGAQL